MKWLTNIRKEERHQEWLKDKVLGEPMPMQGYTASRLKELGIIGVYTHEPKIAPRAPLTNLHLTKESMGIMRDSFRKKAGGAS